MYDSLTDVFQDSKMESWGYISRECKLAGVKYHGNGVVCHDDITSTDSIIKSWKEILEI